MESSQTNNFKGYKFVPLDTYPSYIYNNLTTCDGEFYAFLTQQEPTPYIQLLSKEVVDSGENTSSQSVKWKDNSDSFGLKYVHCNNQWYLVICNLNSCLLANKNGTRWYGHLESKKKMPENKVYFFTCAAKGYDHGSGMEFIAVANSVGEIHYFDIQGQKINKGFGYQLTDENPITAMSGDQKSRTLCVGNSNGFIIIFQCFLEQDWKPVHSIQPVDENPVLSLGTLNRGDNLYVAGFSNGTIKLITPTGVVVCDMGAHSRQLNAIACHPTKSVFASCGDDTFVNIYEVQGDKLEKLDINLVVSSRVNDYMMVGLTFGGDGSNSLVAIPYDFKNLVIWNNII